MSGLPGINSYPVFFAQPSSLCVMCANTNEFQAPTGEVRNVPTKRSIDNVENAKQTFLQSRNNPHQLETQPSLLDKASDLIGQGFNSLGNLFSSIRNSVAPPSFLLIGG